MKTLFNANVEIAHNAHDEMQYFVDLSRIEYEIFDLHICFSHPKLSPALCRASHVQPHPYILHSSGRRSSELNHMMISI